MSISSKSQCIWHSHVKVLGVHVCSIKRELVSFPLVKIVVKWVSVEVIVSVFGNPMLKPHDPCRYDPLPSCAPVSRVADRPPLLSSPIGMARWWEAITKGLEPMSHRFSWTSRSRVNRSHERRGSFDEQWAIKASRSLETRLCNRYLLLIFLRIKCFNLGLGITSAASNQPRQGPSRDLLQASSVTIKVEPTSFPRTSMSQDLRSQSFW